MAASIPLNGPGAGAGSAEAAAFFYVPVSERRTIVPRKIAIRLPPIGQTR